jgi:hypothetical protein
MAKKKEPEVLKDSIKRKYYGDYLIINGKPIDLIDSGKYYPKTFIIRLISGKIKKRIHAAHYVDLMRTAERYTPELYKCYHDNRKMAEMEGYCIPYTEEELLKLDPDVVEPIVRTRKKTERSPKIE